MNSRIWLQANIENSDAGKSWIFEIQVFVFDFRRVSKTRMFENLGFFVIRVFVFDCR